ncbi:hypothetical protein HN385_06930 [archaeon]|jgi:hypothetical protein|nr:hypothetical protein [archaeon]MBT3451007.1 hypothetical protein [archaeon]MBT6868573.1 hypothetical protein [archaeon]MBT7193105.1 hypothetical protein [archaeon]MBT7380422.1 hypothetical protein [archaeon]
MMKLGRKAMMDDWFDYIFTIVAMFFIFLFAGSIFSGQLEQEQESMADQVDNWLGDDNVLSLMSMPIEKEELTMSYYEFITYSQNIEIEDKPDLFYSPTANVLDNIHGSKGWSIYICFEESNGLIGKCWLNANLEVYYSDLDPYSGYSTYVEPVHYGQMFFNDMNNKEINLVYETY